MARHLALIHTVAGLITTFGELTRELLPHWQTFNILDQSLLKGTIERDKLEPVTVRRLVNYVWLAKDGGADAILVTCSTLGPAVDAVASSCDRPVFRVDQAMAEQAIGVGSRVGVLATLTTTLGPTRDIILRSARAAGQKIEIHTDVCEGA